MDGARLPEETAIAVKEAVLPFNRFRTHSGAAVDSLLGPEMRSTGEVMGLHAFFDTAFAKAQASVGNVLPTEGRVFVTVADRDKRAAIVYVKMLQELGFEIITTGGTAQVMRRNGIQCTVVPKLRDAKEGERSIVDMITDGEIALIFNTPSGAGEARGDGYEIRAAATSIGCPLMTTISEFGATIQSIDAQRRHSWDVMSLQDHEATLSAAAAAGREAQQ